MSEVQPEKLDSPQEQDVPKTFWNKIKANWGKLLAYIIAGWAVGEVGAGLGLFLGGAVGAYLGRPWGTAGMTGGAGLGGLIGAVIFWAVGVCLGAGCVWCINRFRKGKR